MRVLCLTSGALAFSKVAEWDVKEPAVLSVAHDLPGMPGASLLGTTFGPFGSDTVFAIGPLEKGSEAAVTTISKNLPWPNQANQVSPKDAEGARLQGSWMIAADGFLIPGKQTGAIVLYDVTEGVASAKPLQVSEDKHAWFYHHTEWYDVDGDKVLDIVAARAIQPLIPTHSKDGELVWIKNNGDGTFGKTEVLVNGPDVGFTLVDLDNDGKTEVVATEFFKHQQLAVYSCQEETWAQCGAKQSVVVTVIAGGPGPWFNCEWVDLNMDGKKEILATQQQFKYKNGTIIAGRAVAFEQPPRKGTWRTEPWTMHVLADGYLPMGKKGVSIGQGAGSPGTAAVVHNKRGPPGILLSADDGGVVDFLKPSGRFPSYTKERVFSTTKLAGNGLRTIGGVVAVDGNLFIPAYTENKVYMFTQDDEAVVV